MFSQAIKSVVCVIVMVLLLGYSPSSVNSKEVLENTLSAIEKIQSLKFHLVCYERIKGVLVTTESQVKMKTYPRSIYIYMKGQELLWVEGKNQGNALINPNGFPFVNLNLSPTGNLMRENQHHTIHEVGFKYFSEIIKSYMLSVADNFDAYFQYEGIISFDNTDCWLITAENKNFKYVDYTVLPHETLISIAQKLHVSDYMILSINSDRIKNYHHLKAGQIIKVPNMYGRKLVLYIDKSTLLPRVIKVYDDKGLYELYEYHNLLLNPKIADEEFKKDYKDYRF